jgi:hypothetical protein
MKKILLLFIVTLCVGVTVYAQNAPAGTKKDDLPTIYITDDISIHFISPEPIQYVDISTHSVIGDLPVKNILRIKAAKDTSKNELGFGFVKDVTSVITVRSLWHSIMSNTYQVLNSKDIKQEFKSAPRI